jgi:hypothetical protein
MPGKFKGAMRFLGEVGDAYITRSEKIDSMSREISRHGWGLDPIQTRKISAILVDHARVTWK